MHMLVVFFITFFGHTALYTYTNDHELQEIIIVSGVGCKVSEIMMTLNERERAAKEGECSGAVRIFN